MRRKLDICRRKRCVERSKTSANFKPDRGEEDKERFEEDLDSGDGKRDPKDPGEH